MSKLYLSNFYKDKKNTNEGTKIVFKRPFSFSSVNGNIWKLKGTHTAQTLKKDQIRPRSAIRETTYTSNCLVAEDNENRN